MGKGNSKSEKVSQSSGSTNPPAGSPSHDVFKSIVVAASSDRDLADKLMDVLEENGGHIIVNSMDDVQKAVGDDNIQKLFSYIDGNKVTGAILICSKNLTEFLDNAENNGNISLQISCKNFDLDGDKLRRAIEEKIGNIGSKLILLSFSEAEQHSCLKALPLTTVKLEDGNITKHMLKDADVYGKVYGRLKEIACKS